MQVQFNTYQPIDLAKICNVCHDPIKNSISVAHTGDGQMHPIHRKCLIKWLEIKEICPTCRVEVDVDSVFTWKDKAIVQLKLMKKDVREALIEGITTAVSGGILAYFDVISIQKSMIPILFWMRWMVKFGELEQLERLEPRPPRIAAMLADAAVLSIKTSALSVMAAIGTAAVVNAAEMHPVAFTATVLGAGVAGQVLSNIIARIFYKNVYSLYFLQYDIAVR